MEQGHCTPAAVKPYRDALVHWRPAEFLTARLWSEVNINVISDCVCRSPGLLIPNSLFKSSICTFFFFWKNSASRKILYLSKLSPHVDRIDSHTVRRPKTVSFPLGPQSILRNKCSTLSVNSVRCKRICSRAHAKRRTHFEPATKDDRKKQNRISIPMRIVRPAKAQPKIKRCGNP